MPRFEKFNGKIFAVNLSKAEEKAMNEEIMKQLAVWVDEASIDVAAAMLFVLRRHFGFGKDRLERFAKLFFEEHEGLKKRYELSETETNYVCRKVLKDECDVDIEKIYKEFYSERG